MRAASVQTVARATGDESGHGVQAVVPDQGGEEEAQGAARGLVDQVEGLLQDAVLDLGAGEAWSGNVARCRSGLAKAGLATKRKSLSR